MDLHTLIEAVLAGDIIPVESPTEANYLRVWQRNSVSDNDTFVVAALGGALADRLAWVFVAGYQATIRRCFPNLPRKQGWDSFVNSEDRSGSLPGTSLTGTAGNRRLSGWKTWVATAEHVERLLVSARQGETPFVVVHRSQSGVCIESGDQRAFLSEMSQGRVEFANIPIAEDQILGDEYTFSVFRASESTYFRAALNAFIFSHACRLKASADLIAHALSGLFCAAAIQQLPLPSAAAAAATLGLDLRTRALARDFEAFIQTKNPALYALWDKDRQLINGASKGISARAAKALSGVSAPTP